MLERGNTVGRMYISPDRSDNMLKIEASVMGKKRPQYYSSADYEDFPDLSQLSWERGQPEMIAVPSKRYRKSISLINSPCTLQIWAHDS